MIKKISVITACYNQGIYLDDAFDSIHLDKYSEYFEHIIVNDGSTDKFTLQKISELEKKGSIIIHQLNKGLGAARNAGIEIATGKYIIPLDCDNKLNPKIIIKASEILDKDESISVVYTDAEYFGNKKGRWNVGPFNLFYLLINNYIDACALFRKSAWQKIEGYDINMPSMGHEDWDFWINLYFHNLKFYYFPKKGFSYRITNSQMRSTLTLEKYNNTRNYIFLKYIDFIPGKYSELYGLAYPKWRRLGMVWSKLLLQRIANFIINIFKKLYIND